MIRGILQSLGRAHIDVAFRSGPDLQVRIVERPGRWMDAPALADLAARLRDVAARSLDGKALDYGVFSGDPRAFDRVIVTLVSDASGRTIAFNALTVMQVEMPAGPTEVLHLGLVMVDPDHREKNLSWLLYGLTCFLVFMRRQFRPVWISSVTQVPAVVGMVAGMFSDVWPRPDGGPRRLPHLLLARRIMEGQRHVFGVSADAGFDEARFVITDAYRGGSDELKKTWEQAPKHRDPRFNTFCAEALDYGRGDDVLQLGLMNMGAMRRYLQREVPRSALLGVMVTAALVALQRLVLPVVHWFDSRRQWSLLRPRGGA